MTVVLTTWVEFDNARGRLLETNPARKPSRSGPHIAPCPTDRTGIPRIAATGILGQRTSAVFQQAGGSRGRGRQAQLESALGIGNDHPAVPIHRWRSCDQEGLQRPAGTDVQS